MPKTEKLLFIVDGWSTADPPTDDDHNKILKPSRHLTSIIITRWPFVNRVLGLFADVMQISETREFLTRSAAAVEITRLSPSRGEMKVGAIVGDT